MRTKVIISLIIYVVLAITIVCLVYWRTVSQGKSFDEFSKGAGVGVTLLTSLLAGAISLIVANSQQKAAADLEKSKGEIAKEVNRENATFNTALTTTLNDHTEKLKSDFALEVGGKLEAIRNGFVSQMEVLKSSLAKEVAKETEILKNNLTTNLEFLKVRFGLERESFRKLSEAAAHYYHGLASLERGTFDSAAVKTAEDFMVDASSFTSQLLDDKPKAVWYDLWQVARSISEVAQSKSTDKEALMSLWADRGPRLGALISEFEEIASLSYRGAPSAPSASSTTVS